MYFLDYIFHINCKSIDSCKKKKVDLDVRQKNKTDDARVSSVAKVHVVDTADF